MGRLEDLGVERASPSAAPLPRMRSQLQQQQERRLYPLLRLSSFPLISLLDADRGKNLLTQGQTQRWLRADLGNEPPNSNRRLPRLHGCLKLSLPLCLALALPRSSVPLPCATWALCLLPGPCASGGLGAWGWLWESS